MFYSHFNLDQNPFMECPPLAWLLKDERFDQGLARLEYFAREGLAALLLGNTGTGKSSLLRLFKHHLDKNRCPVHYLHLTHLTASGLLRLLVAELGEEPRLGKDRLFRQILQCVNKSETPTMLLLDEAHLLHADALTDLRLLLGSLTEQTPKLKIVLCGQEPLRLMLNRQAQEDLTARIAVRYRLTSLNEEQTSAYIKARMKNAGASKDIFQDVAVDAIHEYAQGNPRQINNIATACLINAAIKNEGLITETDVNQAMNEVRLP